MKPFKDHVPLREHVWFKTGGVAEYYALCQSPSDIVSSASFALKNGIPYFVLGAGANCLVSDSGIPGLVIANQTQSFVLLHDRSQIIVDSGMSLVSLVMRTVSSGYSGLEFLVSIPGTVGGALATNVTAFGYSLGDYVRNATVFFPELAKAGKDPIQQVDRSWFQFGYRTSALQMTQDEFMMRPIILSVTLQLSKMNPAACQHKLAYYHRLRLQEPGCSKASLQVFDCLAADARPLAPSLQSRRVDQAKKVCTIVMSTLAPGKQPHCVWLRTNPNYLLHDGYGTSKEANERIQMLRSLLDEPGVTPRIEYIGLWSEPDMAVV